MIPDRALRGDRSFDMTDASFPNRCELCNSLGTHFRLAFARSQIQSFTSKISILISLLLRLNAVIKNAKLAFRMCDILPRIHEAWLGLHLCLFPALKNQRHVRQGGSDFIGLVIRKTDSIS